MERKILLLYLIAMLTLMTIENGASTVGRTLMDVQDFMCRWEHLNHLLVCGFTQLGPLSLRTDLQYDLTLDNLETVRCQQPFHNKGVIQCIFEGLLKKKMKSNESHKFELHMESGNDVQTQEFNLNLLQDPNGVSITWIIGGCMLIVITLIIPYYTILRKLRQMSNITVMHPDFSLEDNPTNIEEQKC